MLCGCGSFFSGELAADGDGREPQGKGGSVSRCFGHLVYVKSAGWQCTIKVSSCLVAAGEKRGFFVGGTEDSGLTVRFNELRGGIGSGSGGMESSIAGIEVSPLNVQLPWGLLARNSSTLSWLWLWLAEVQGSGEGFGFCGFVAICESFLREIWGVAFFGVAQVSNPRKFSLRKLYFSPIREGILPRKFPTIWYISSRHGTV